MLNTKLFEEFGNESRLFFGELAKNVDKDVLRNCYAIVGDTVESGSLTAPRRIAVKSNNIADIKTVNHHCIDISMNIGNEEDERIVTCRKFKPEQIEKDGIKIWV